MVASPLRSILALLGLLAALCMGGCLFGEKDSVGPGSADAGPDTSVSLSDSVRLRARGLPKGIGWRIEWDIGMQGRFVPVPGGDTLILGADTISHSYHVLRVRDSEGNIDLDTFKVAVYNDIPVAKLLVSFRKASEGSGQVLSGSAIDLGHTFHYAWKFGDSGAFVPASGPDTVYAPNLPDGQDVKCSLMVTDDDGNHAKAGTVVTVTYWQEIGKVLPPKDFNAPYSATAFRERIHVSGGYTDDGIFHPVILAWDPVSETWSRFKPDLPRPTTFRLVAAGDRLFAVNEAEPPELWEFDARVDDWVEQKEPPFRQNSKFGLTASNGRIFIVGGHPFNSLDKVQSFDPETDEWSVGADVPIDIWEHALTGMDGKIYAVGGRGSVPGGRNRILWELDPQSDQWAALDTLVSATILPAAVSHKGKAYCLGGLDGGLTAQAYDRASNRWSKISPSPYPIEGEAAVIIKGVIYAFSPDWEFQAYVPRGN